jgi:RsiW-degrading membrane proteinase PrsW (M82 family)
MYGMLSIFFVSAIHFIFPHWMEYLSYTTESIYTQVTPNKFTIDFVKVPTVAANIFHWFVQVGLTEEICKALTFLLITGLRLKSLRISDKPYAIMFYSMMVSMGFAVVENIHYAWRFLSVDGADPMDVLLVRTVTSVIAHMIFGLIMGYFFGLGFKSIRGYNSEPTKFNIWGRTHVKTKRTLFFTMGILVAAFFHGMYDFILSLGVSWATVAEFLIVGLMTTYLMSRRSIRKS